jgi:hypothetical protein
VKRCLLAAGASLLLVGAWAAPAAAQGLVLGKDSAPLPAARVRALLVFQELGGFANPNARAADNCEDLLVELELAAPAPEGAVWVLSAPGRAEARPGAAGALDELSALWREWPATAGEVGAVATPPERWTRFQAKEGSAAFSEPLDLAALRERLKGRGLELPPQPAADAERQAAEGWSFFLAEVPAGWTRLCAHLKFKSVVARYPGALGARSSIGPMGPIGPIGLPPLELMVLHSHFINVDDNAVNSLQPRLGLGRVYQDSGTLRAGGQLWAKPAESRPGPVRDSAERLKAAAEFVAAAAPEGRFFLTVVAGAPASVERARLDFFIYSHYPSGMDPLPPRSAFLWLGAVSVGLLIMAVWLLKRKGFAE